MIVEGQLRPLGGCSVPRLNSAARIVPLRSRQNVDARTAVGAGLHAQLRLENLFQQVTLKNAGWRTDP
jgi:hypothetical protein